MITYLNGTFGELEDTAISPDDRGFLMADGLYEVVRFYRGRPLGMAAHRARLEAGARSLRFPQTEFPGFDALMMQLIERNGLGAEDSATAYLQVTRGVAPRSHSFPPRDTPLTIYGFARRFRRHEDEIADGAAAITQEDDRWAHCDIKTIALLPNTLAHQKAREAGAVEALFIRDGALQEGTHCNVMICREGRVRTPPLSHTILAGVTRELVLELARKLGIPSDEAPVTVEELFDADEVFLVGTTVEITPIVVVDAKTIADGRPGPLTRALQKRFFARVDRL
ncbi:MAG: aminotransferase class IV [Xanthomonadales bacterium]